MPKAAFDIQLQGHTPAFRDTTIELVNQATGQSVTRKPFLDGQLIVRDLDPGNWELTVRHPNLIAAIDRRVIKLFPQPFPTRIPVPVDPGLFRDTPIRDIPDADLAPIQQTASAAATNAGGVGGKAPGEVIRAEDWNVLASAVADLARSVGELARLVSPQGHDHPEIAEKIGEVQGNILRFTDSFGRSLLELRREIESQNLRRRLDDVLDRGGATSAVRDRVKLRLDQIETATQVSTPQWTTAIASHGNAMLREVMDLAQAQGDAATFLASPEVNQTMTLLQNFANAPGLTRPEDELQVYRRGVAEVGSPFVRFS